MKLGSLFSGVGGFDAGFVAAGFDVRWQCENEPACKDVLRARFPETAVLYDDIRTVNWEQAEPVDVIVGGFPCQDLSVAGRRAGLDGVRSGLFFHFARVLDTVRPTIAVIENVPGLLSSNGGRDMAIVLGTLRDIGAVDIAWCVLDAQWFGVPQRRRRVFLVCDFAGERASEILSLPEGLHGHPPPRRTQGESVAASLTGGSHPNSNRPGRHREDDVNLALYLTAHEAKGGDPTVDNYLVTHSFTNRGYEQGTGAETLRAGSHGAIPMVAHSLTGVEPDASSSGVCMCAPLGATRQTPDEEDGTGRGTPLTVFGVADDTAYSLRANPSHSGDKGDGGINTTLVATAFTERTRKDGRNLESQEELAYALTNPGAGGRTQERRVLNAMGVRRLTPTECERLMGWPEAKETVIIEVWKENCGESQKSDAPVESPSHRSQRPAGSAARSKSPTSARSAASPSRTSNQTCDRSVAMHVEINLETRVLDVRTSSGESLLHANIADSNGWSRNQKQPSDFAHLAALISSTLARTTLDGRAASVLSRSSSSVPSSGSACVVVSGREIAASVSDAERYINEATRCMKSITSAVGQSSLTSDSILRTLCCCATHAISGFIPETIRNESSYAFALTIASGHTRYGASGKEMSDSTRYRMAGNGVVAPVAEWIARRVRAALP